MLNVNRMRILREVASRGSIAAAAEALYMTPSAISQQMSVLEREAGVELLDRSHRKVRLTPAGERLVARTEQVLAVLEEAQAELAAVAGGLAGRLSICAFPTAARAIMVPALELIRRANRGIELRVSDLEPEESIPALKIGEMDVVVTYEFDHLPTPKDPGVERIVLMREPMYVAMHRDHRAADGPLRIADLASEQWVVGRDGSPFLEVQVRVANEAGFEPNIHFHSNDYQVILAAVQADLGIALVPPLAMFSEYPDVVLRAPDDIEVNRRIVAAVRAGSAQSPAVAAALAALGAAAEQAAARDVSSYLVT